MMTNDDIMKLYETQIAVGGSADSVILRTVKAAIQTAEERLEHCQYFHGVREKRLWHWAHEELNENQKTRYFNIVANGTASVHESPTYAQQFNTLKHRAETAEAEVERLTKCLAKANSQFEEFERRYYLETDKTDALKSALERITESYKALLSSTPVRDADEVLAEANRVIKDSS